MLRCKYCHRLQDINRTGSQNAALHLFLTQLSQVLNDSGYSVQKILAQAMDIDWNPKNAKELLWRNSQRAILGIESTTELRKTEDIDRVYDHLARHLGQIFGIEIPPWPHYADKDNAVLKQYEKTPA